MLSNLENFLQMSTLPINADTAITLIKSLHSKNITIGDWNTLILQTSSLVSKNSETYNAFCEIVKDLHSSNEALENLKAQDGVINETLENLKAQDDTINENLEDLHDTTICEILPNEYGVFFIPKSGDYCINAEYKSMDSVDFEDTLFNVLQVYRCDEQGNIIEILWERIDIDSLFYSAVITLGSVAEEGMYIKIDGADASSNHTPPKASVTACNSFASTTANRLSTLEGDAEEVRKTVSVVQDRVDVVESVAKGAAQSKSFESYKDLIEDLNTQFSNTEFSVGQHFLIKTLNVPDVWVYAVSEDHEIYAYQGNEDAFASDLIDGLVQVGYYILSALETQKVDLTDYVKTIDYASPSKAGAVKVTGSNGIYVGNTGNIGIQKASKSQIAGKTETYSPLVPQYLDYAVKVGITTNTETLTDEEKNSALKWLGANGVIRQIVPNEEGLYPIHEAGTYHLHVEFQQEDGNAGDYYNYVTVYAKNNLGFNITILHESDIPFKLYDTVFEVSQEAATYGGFYVDAVTNGGAVWNNSVIVTTSNALSIANDNRFKRIEEVRAALGSYITDIDNLLGGE